MWSEFLCFSQPLLFSISFWYLYVIIEYLCPFVSDAGLQCSRRKAESRTVCCWQLKITQGRKGPNGRWSFSVLCTWLVYWMGMATQRLLCIECLRLFCSTLVASLTHLFFVICSFKHIFSFLMISWMALIRVGASPAGSDYQRCELLTRVNLFLVQFSF